MKIKTYLILSCFASNTRFKKKTVLKENFKNYFYDNGIDFQAYIWIVTEEADFSSWNHIPVEKREDTDIIYVTSLPSKESFSFHGRVY